MYLVRGSYLKEIKNIKVNLFKYELRLEWLNFNYHVQIFDDEQTYNINRPISIESEEKELNWMVSLRDFCGQLISGQKLVGKILLALVSIFSVASLVIYISDAITKYLIFWLKRYG